MRLTLHHHHAAPAHPARRRAALVVALLLASPLLALVLAGAPAAGDTLAPVKGALPTPRHSTAAVWTGSEAFVFGGHLGAQGRDQVVRYDPVADRSSVQNARLPTGREGMAAVWDGTHAYLFGGNDDAPLRDILRYDPATDTLVVLETKLPFPLQRATAAWDGTHAYLFGGHDGNTARADILRFTPATGEVTLIPAALPTPRSGASAVWTGSAAYIFGGLDAAPLAEVVRFDPASGTVTLLPMSLGTPRYGASAVWSDGAAYLFGGQSPDGRLREILRIVPHEGLSLLRGATLPMGLVWTSAVWTGDSALVFGGCCPAKKDILRYTLEPGAPRDVAATSGGGGIQLSWRAPSEDTTASPILSYRIYRGTESGALTLHAEVPPTLADPMTLLDTGLAPRTTYYYQVSAMAAEGEGLRSPEVNATSLLPPSPPRDLVARSGPDAGQVTLTWQPPAEEGDAPLAGYTLSWSLTPDLATYAPLTDLPADALGYTDSGIPDGELRYYRLTARSDAGESDPSNEAYAAAFTAPGTEPASLPGPRAATSAVWSGTHAYVFGGVDGNGQDLADIVRFDPRTRESAPLEVTLPSPRHGTSAAWIPTHTHDTSDPSLSACHPTCMAGLGVIIGGALSDAPSLAATAEATCDPGCPEGQQLVLFDPSTGEVWLSGASLPSPRQATASAWVPTVETTSAGVTLLACHPTCLSGSVFVFGGIGPTDSPSLSATADTACPDPCAGTQILRYDPGTDTLTTLATPLPGPRHGMSAVHVPGADGGPGHIYLLGGRGPEGDLHDILRFDPVTEEVVTMSATLPAGRCCGSAVWDGQYAFLFGGYEGDQASATILRYDPATDTVTAAGELPSGRALTSAVHDGSTAYVFGGEGDGETFSDIVEFRPTAPQGVAVTAGPGAGEATLSWNPPVDEGSSAVIAYRIYRNVAGAGWVLHAEVAAPGAPFRDTGIPEDTPVAYKVSALNAHGESPQSVPATARTFARPDAPRNVSAESGRAIGEIVVRWEAPAEDGGMPVTDYHVYRQEVPLIGGPTAFVRIATYDASARDHVDPDCPPGATCTYVVSAENLVGEGAFSDAASASSLPLLGPPRDSASAGRWRPM